MALPSTHEITPLHLHAAGLPDRFAPARGHPDAHPFSYSETKTGAALETDRPGKTDAGRIAVAICVRKTNPVSQAKAFAHAFTQSGFVGLPSRLFLSFSSAFPDPESFAYSETHARP